MSHGSHLQILGGKLLKRERAQGRRGVLCKVVCGVEQAAEGAI